MKKIPYNKPIKYCLKYVLFLLYLTVAVTADCQGIRDRPFRDIDGNPINFASYTGKKLVFIILPVNAPDSFITQMKVFMAKYGGKVQVIGILSQEDGHSAANKADVKAVYKNTGILLTELMVSRKGNGQSPLMKWLTGKKENGHFDMDVRCPLQKFFVDSKGRLYAVLGSQVPLLSTFLDRVVNATETDDLPTPAKGKAKT